MVELHQRKRQLGFQPGDAERRVIELHLFLVVAMRRVVAAENLDRPIRQPFQYGLAVARRTQRRVHLEVRVVCRPARLSAAAGIEAKHTLTVRVPESVTAGYRRIREREVMRASLSGNW